jgi:hypothetical protein
MHLPRQPLSPHMNTNLTPRRQARFITRPLRLGDIPALVDLEKKQWTDEQAATAETFRQRILEHPHLCAGAFRSDTGELVASLFCKPTSASEWVHHADWATRTQHSHHGKADALFGISLTSIEGGAALQLVAYQFLDAIKRGIRYVYLGSPMPGLAKHLSRDPQASVEAYARATRAGLPLDPQLRYYHGRGFRELIAVVDNYFPHEASRNYGAILRAKVPHTWLRPMLCWVPQGALRMLSALAPRLSIPQDRAAAR